MEIPNLQRYPWTLNLIKNVEDTVVFMAWKMCNSGNFSFASYEQEMRKQLSQKNLRIKINWAENFRMDKL